MKNTNKVFGYLVTLVAIILMSTAFASAQESVVGTITFYPGGSTRVDQVSNSVVTIGGHTLTCSQSPVWHASEIQNSKNPTITNVSYFGPCTIDGVFVRDFILMQAKDGVLLTIHTNDGKTWSLMLVNSAGIRLTDLTGIYYKGSYAANSVVGFNLIGNVQ